MSASAKNLAVGGWAEVGQLPRRLRPLYPWDSRLRLKDVPTGDCRASPSPTPVSQVQSQFLGPALGCPLFP